MARSGKKARLRGIGELCLPPGYLQRIRRLPASTDVGKGDDDALDPVVLGAVRQYAADVPGAAASFDFPFERREALQHRSGIPQESTVGSQRVEVRKWPPHVAGNDAEK